MTFRLKTALTCGALVLAMGGIDATALVSPAAAAGSTLTVNSTGDGTDAHAGDGICATATGDCSLRAAIQEADAASTAMTIAFAIPGTGPFTIAPATRLPNLTNTAGITIDGYTQAGSVPNTAQYGSNATLMIQIKGLGAGQFDGLEATAGTNTFRGLSIYNFRHSFFLTGSSTGHNQITGNFICTDAGGTFRQPTINGGAGGIIIQNGSSYNTIGVSQSYTPAGGPPSVADRNTISGCAHRGVIISYVGTDYNVVQDNVVGLNPSGTAALPNDSHGIDVNYNAQHTMIGGPNPGEGNVVSGNLQEGIEVSHGPYNRYNNVINNDVGTGIDGTTAPSYAANGMMGIRLEGEKECDPCDPNAGYITVSGNVVVGNAQGILIDKGQQHNTVTGNWIGVLKDGTAAPNGEYGVRVEHGAVFNTIGPANIIAYNPVGIELDATESQPPSSYVLATYSNTITQNSIYGNTGLGIDLAPYNQPNVGAQTDSNVQNGIATPVLDKGTRTTLTGTACAGCTVEVYQADVFSVSSSYTLRNYGQGKTYLGSVTASSTDGSFSFSPAGGFFTNQVLTADATDSAGNTSEFAKDIVDGLVPSPSLNANAINYANQAAYPVSGTANPGDTVNVSATDNTTTVTGSTTVNSAGNWSLKLNASSLAEGPVKVSATAVEDGVSSAATTATVTKATRAGAPKTTVTPTDTSLLVKWVAPANGGSPVDGYRVTLLQGSTVVSQTSVSSSTLSTNFTGLPQNTAYTVTVEAHTAAGYGAASSTATKTRITSAVSIMPSSITVPTNGTLTLSGVVTRKDTGAGLASQNVEVDQVNSDNSITVLITNVPTDSAGKWRYSFTPTATAKYRAVYVGVSPYGYSKSPNTQSITYG